MKLTVDISMYPIREDYLPPIDAVIAKLNSYANEDTKVNTFATATTIIGDYDIVMEIIRETIVWSYEEFGKAVFVTKFIPGYGPN